MISLDFLFLWIFVLYEFKSRIFCLKNDQNLVGGKIALCFISYAEIVKSLDSLQ